MVVFSPSFAGASRPPVQQFRGQTARPASQPLQGDEVKFGKSKKVKEAEVILNAYLPGYSDKLPGYMKAFVVDMLDAVPGLGDYLTYKKTKGFAKDATMIGASKNSVRLMYAAMAIELAMDVLFPFTAGTSTAADLPATTTTAIAIALRKIAVRRAEEIRDANK